MMAYYQESTCRRTKFATGYLPSTAHYHNAYMYFLSLSWWIIKSKKEKKNKTKTETETKQKQKETKRKES